jgi:hypothetical protein
MKKAHGSSALRVLSATESSPTGPLPHGSLSMAATRCTTPFAALWKGIGRWPMLSP